MNLSNLTCEKLNNKETLLLREMVKRHMEANLDSLSFVFSEPVLANIVHMTRIGAKPRLESLLDGLMRKYITVPMGTGGNYEKFPIIGSFSYQNGNYIVSFSPVFQSFLVRGSSDGPTPEDVSDPDADTPG